MLELFRAAGAILLACDAIISERAGTQVGTVVGWAYLGKQVQWGSAGSW